MISEQEIAVQYVPTGTYVTQLDGTDSRHLDSAYFVAGGHRTPRISECNERNNNVTGSRERPGYRCRGERDEPPGY